MKAVTQLRKTYEIKGYRIQVVADVFPADHGSLKCIVKYREWDFSKEKWKSDWKGTEFTPNGPGKGKLEDKIIKFLYFKYL